MCRIASGHGYDVLMVMDSAKPVEHIARLIDNRKIDGVIAMRSLVNSPVVGFLKEKQVPFVIIGPTSDREVLSVDNDNRSACRDITAHLIAQGIRRMVLIYLHTSGVRVPQDVKVVSFYDSILLENNIPSVTSLHFDAAALGEAACQKLIDRLRGEPDNDFALPGYRIIQRDSTK